MRFACLFVCLFRVFVLYASFVCFLLFSLVLSFRPVNRFQTYFEKTSLVNHTKENGGNSKLCSYIRSISSIKAKPCISEGAGLRKYIICLEGCYARMCMQSSTVSSRLSVIKAEMSSMVKARRQLAPFSLAVVDTLNVAYRQYHCFYLTVTGTQNQLSISHVCLNS